MQARDILQNNTLRLTLESALNKDNKALTSHDLVASIIELEKLRDKMIVVFLLFMASSDIESAVSDTMLLFGQMDLNLPFGCLRLLD